MRVTAAPSVYAVTTGPLPRIVAVVVTFNRLALLETLVARLGEIDGLAEVLVIDNASSDGTGEWLAPPPHRRGPVGVPVAVHQPRRRRRVPRRPGLGHRPRGRPGLAHGRRRPARRRLPRPAARGGREPRLLGPAGRGRGRPLPPGLPDPAPGRDPRRARRRRRTPCRARGPDRRHRHPVQRRPRHQGARRPDRAAARGVLHLGRRPRVPAAGRGGRRARGHGHRPPLRHPSVGDLGTPMVFGRTTYNHSPSDLKHYCMARNNLVNLRDYRGPCTPPRSW